MTLPLIDILFDHFNEDPQEKTLILTDSGWPVTLFPQEIQVHTPYLTVSDEFGVRYQSGIAQQVHGLTGIPVNKPYVGQMLYFWSNSRWAIISPRQKVLRVYNNKELAKVTPIYIKQVLAKLGSRWVTKMQMLPNKEVNDPISFILAMTCELITQGNQKDWMLTEHQSSAFPTVAKVNGQNPEGASVFYHAGYVVEKGKHIHLTNATIVLLMEAIHKAYPMRTKIDSNGILQLVS